MVQENKEITACLKLIRWHGVSVKQKYKVVTKMGSFAATIELKKVDWEKKLQKKLSIHFMPVQCCVDEDFVWLRQLGNYFISIFDSDYPESLKQLIDPPLGLYVKGNIKALSSVQIAIVGSRRQTPVGKKIASQFSQNLCHSGITVTSGLAKGIDASAHYAACESHGQTVAILACGLDIIYPRQNQALAELIQAHGCLVSEFPIGTPPRRENFPARNRIIAGLSEGVLVVEAARRSGSLITARLACELGKEVFAVPGSILSPESMGCHWLIQQGAVLTQNIDDILVELQLPILLKIKSEETQSKVKLDGACEVLDLMGYEATSVDELCTRSNFDFQTLSLKLMELELDGLIARAHNGDYFRLT